MTTALKSSNFITWDDYVDSQDTHTQHARQEFGKVHNSIDAVKGDITAIKHNVEVMKGDITAIKHNVEAVRQELKGDIEAVRLELKGDVAAVKTDLAQFKHDVNEEFEKVHNDVAELKHDVAELKDDVEEVKVDFKRMDALSYNRALHNPRLPPRAVAAYRPGKGIVIPQPFPKNAREFFGLKNPSTIYQLSLLIYLVKFYDVEGYQHWGAEDTVDEVEDGHGSPSSQEDVSVEVAVVQHPEMAVDTLAAIVGLIEDNFIAFEARAAEHQERQPQAPVKRQQSQVQHLAQQILKEEEMKRRRLEVRPSATELSPNTWEKLLRPNQGSSSDEPSERTKLMWDNDGQGKRTGPTLRHPHGTESKSSESKSSKSSKSRSKPEASLRAPSEPYLGSPTSPTIPNASLLTDR